MLADPLVYLWPLGITLFVAATFAWVVMRGLRTGKMRTQAGNPVDLERHPVTFWLLGIIYALSALVILAVAFGNFWKPFVGG